MQDQFRALEDRLYAFLVRKPFRKKRRSDVPAANESCIMSGARGCRLRRSLRMIYVLITVYDDAAHSPTSGSRRSYVLSLSLSVFLRATLHNGFRSNAVHAEATSAAILPCYTLQQGSFSASRLRCASSFYADATRYSRILLRHCGLQLPAFPVLFPFSSSLICQLAEKLH